jgi:hypothetical protein
LSQARKKLKSSAFVALNRLWVQAWHEAATFELCPLCQASCRFIN